MVNNEKVAVISGVTGQDGAYLSRFLLQQGYTVHGLRRRTSGQNTARIQDIIAAPQEQSRGLFLHYGDITDSSSLIHLLERIQPDEVYNLAAQSHVKTSFETPEYTAQADAVGTLRFLEAIRILGLGNKTKFYQASTSELYGKVREIPQTEKTPFHPRSPYGVAKLYAYWITVNYRESYDIFASNGILFNHESPIRGRSFVTRKITSAAAKILFGQQDCLFLGNLNAERDWGHAREYCEGMWKILQHDSPDDFVLSSNTITSVREFLDHSFKCLGINLEFEGKDLDEIGRCDKTGKTLVKVDPFFFRPAEVDLLQGDPSKAKEMLGWQASTSVQDLSKEMAYADLFLAAKEAGYDVGPKPYIDLVTRPSGITNWFDTYGNEIIETRLKIFRDQP